MNAREFVDEKASQLTAAIESARSDIIRYDNLRKMAQDALDGALRELEILQRWLKDPALSNDSPARSTQSLSRSSNGLSVKDIIARSAKMDRDFTPAEFRAMLLAEFPDANAHTITCALAMACKEHRIERVKIGVYRPIHVTALSRNGSALDFAGVTTPE